jgi:N-carbamoyl-L-amino-acid hydrolase
LPYIDIPSGAGHDAAIFANYGVPSAMLFVRNDKGSHNPDEKMDLGDFMMGVEVLYQAVTNEGSAR